MGSRSAPVEQPGGGQNETAEAEADDNSAVGVGGPNGRQRFIGWSFASAAPAGQHDDGCLVQGVEAKRRAIDLGRRRLRDSGGPCMLGSPTRRSLAHA